MKLFCEDRAIQVNVTGYQFPYDPLRTIYDNNWLMVHIRLTEGVLTYSFDDPCMTSHELADLVRGLENVARGLTVESEAQFIEPYLRLHTHRCVGGILVNLGVALTAEEDDPDFVDLQERLEGNDWERFWVSAILSDEDFRVMIRRFREMADRFPIRWPPPIPREE